MRDGRQLKTGPRLLAWAAFIAAYLAIALMITLSPVPARAAASGIHGHDHPLFETGPGVQRREQSKANPVAGQGPEPEECCDARKEWQGRAERAI